MVCNVLIYTSKMFKCLPPSKDCNTTFFIFCAALPQNSKSSIIPPKVTFKTKVLLKNVILQPKSSQSSTFQVTILH